MYMDIHTHYVFLCLMYVLILFSCLKSEGILGVAYIPWNFLGLRSVFCSNEVTVGPSERRVSDQSCLRAEASIETPQRWGLESSRVGEHRPVLSWRGHGSAGACPQTLPYLSHWLFLSCVLYSKPVNLSQVFSQVLLSHSSEHQT